MPVKCLVCEAARPTELCSYCGGKAHSMGTIDKGANRVWRYWCLECFHGFIEDMDMLAARRRRELGLPEPDPEGEEPSDMQDLSTDSEDSDHDQEHHPNRGPV